MIFVCSKVNKLTKPISRPTEGERSYVGTAGIDGAGMDCAGADGALAGAVVVVVEGVVEGVVVVVGMGDEMDVDGPLMPAGLAT